MSSPVVPRKSYSVDYKLKVLAFCDQHGRRLTMARFCIDSSMLSRWIMKRGELISIHKTCRNNKKRYRAGAPGRRPVHYVSGTEKQLHEWIQQQRSECSVISMSMVQDEMLKHTRDSHPGFKASFGWLYGFMKRFHLSLRMPTGMLKGGRHTMDANELQVGECIRAFGQYISQVHARHHIANVINVDQTPVWWNALGSQQRTITTKGTRNVLVKQLQQQTKPRDKVSVILACMRDGRKLPPAIIVKTDRTHLKRARIKLLNGVLIFLNPRTSMANSDIMQRWVRLMMSDECKVDTRSKNLLIMDSFRGHLTEEVKQACRNVNAVQAVIPGGLTSHLQPLDLTVNRSFKAHLRKEYSSMLRQCLNNGDARHTPMERLHVLAGAVRRCWNRVERTIIRNGFKVMFRNMRYARKYT